MKIKVQIINKMTDEKALQILEHRKGICNECFTLETCNGCNEECLYPNVINALLDKIEGKKMDKNIIDYVWENHRKKAEQWKCNSIFSIMGATCPGDYDEKLKQYECSEKDSIDVNGHDCYKCWTQRLEDE